MVTLLYAHGDERLAGYPEIGDAAYGRPGLVVVHFFHKATLFGVSTLFLILAGKFLCEGLGGGGEGLVPSIGNDEAAWTQNWTVVATAVMLVPMLLLRSIGEIAPLSALGMSASATTVVVVVACSLLLAPIGAASDVPLDPAFAASNATSVTHQAYVVATLPSAFAAITLSFGGHAVFPSIEHDMVRPGSFARVLDASFAALVVMYLAVAAVGYGVFGDEVYSPILCNLPRSTSTAIGAIGAATKLLIALHTLCAYPILMNAAVLELEALCDVDRVKWPAWRRLAARTCLRTCCVLGTGAVALFVPYFAEMMTLVGAMCLTAIVFVLPVVFSFKLRGAAMGPGERVVGAFAATIGACAGAVGSFQAVQSIVEKLASGAAQ